MAVIIKNADLGVSADAAWGIVERFMRADIRVFSFIEENRIEGPIRTVISNGGQLAQPELNITVDPEHRYASYTLLESPFWSGGTHHHGSMRVTDSGEGRCRFEWITDISPDSYAVTFRDFIDGYGLWSDLLKVLETGEEAAPPPTVVG